MINTAASSNAMVDYAAKLAALKNELQSLCNLITTAVMQLKNDITSLHATLMTTDMETNAAHSTETKIDLPAIIAELKHNIATIALEM